MTDTTIQQLQDAAAAAVRDRRSRAYVKAAARGILDALDTLDQSGVRTTPPPVALETDPWLGSQLMDLALRVALVPTASRQERAAVIRAAAAAVRGCAPNLATAELAVEVIAVARQTHTPFSTLAESLRPWGRMRGSVGKLVTSALHSPSKGRHREVGTR